MNGRHVKFVKISPEVILSFLIPPGATTVDGCIPVGARALRAGISEYGDIMLIIEHESFPEVPDGVIAPELRPQYRRTEVRRRVDLHLAFAPGDVEVWMMALCLRDIGYLVGEHHSLCEVLKEIGALKMRI